MEYATRNDPPAEPSRPTPVRPITGARGGTRASGGTGGNDLEQAITVLRARIDEEFRISERLDSKSRQAFALAAGFFAVVQTVAFGAFAQDNVDGLERFLMLAAAVIAAGAVIVVADRLTNGEELLEEADVTPEAIVGWCEEADDPEYVPARLVRELARMARRRAENNEIRARRYDRVVVSTRWALILAGLELLVAIFVRL